jgi:preprotein translocase subunit SecG
MKGDTQDRLLAPREERAILDEIRNDHELRARLKITPQELEALSKCALLGTLTCKQDMLFILRQLRDATSPEIDSAAVFPQPPPTEDLEEDPAPDFRRVPARISAAAIREAGPLDGIVRRRLPEQFGVLFWAVILVVAVVWNGIIVMSRWRDSFMTTIGSPVSLTSASEEWYSHLDRFSVLLAWEALFLIAIVGVTYLRSRRDSRRFKVRPGGQRYR